MYIVGRFLRRKGRIELRVFNIISLAFSLDDPHWNRGVGQAGFIEVEYEFLAKLVVHVSFV